jgi:hypothetical protein
MADLSPIQLARFWSRIEPAPDFQCWEWRGAGNASGYGRWGGMMAHRVAYELVNGPIPDRLIVRHKCDNPACCNPKHLEVGTHADNSADCLARDRFSKGQRHGRTKITEEQLAIIHTNPERLTVRQMADLIGCAPSTVSMIRSGQRRSP